jgi:hypothetical protein
MAVATYLMSGEFGEFHPTTSDSREEMSSLVVTTEPWEPADQASADVHASTDVENDIPLEMPMDHMMTQFIEAQPEARAQAYHVRCDDRQQDSIVAFTSAALDALVQDVATYTGFETQADRNDYAASPGGRNSPVRPTASSTTDRTSHEPYTQEPDC